MFSLYIARLKPILVSYYRIRALYKNHKIIEGIILVFIIMSELSWSSTI